MVTLPAMIKEQQLLLRSSKTRVPAPVILIVAPPIKNIVLPPVLPCFIAGRIILNKPILFEFSLLRYQIILMSDK